MEDLPIPETGGEGIILAGVLAVIVGLYLLVRRTYQRADDDYWERRRRHEKLRKEPLPEPEDPRELPRRPDEGPGP